MDNRLIEVTRELVKSYGVSLLEDPERLGQLLEDKCEGRGREIFLLSFALKDIIKGGRLPDADELAARRSDASEGLCSRLGFSRADAEWAVDAISSILEAGAESPSPRSQIEARRGFLSGIEDVGDSLAKRPRTAPLRKKAFRNGFLLLCILSLFLALFVRVTGARVTQADEHRLLFLAHLSGPDAALGHVRLKGAQLAADQINDQGGVKGRMIRIQAQDMPQDPALAVRAALGILSENRATAIISSCNDSVNIALAALADKNEIPLISTESGHAGVTMATDERPWLYSFSVTPDNAYMGSTMAYFISQGLNRKKSAVLFRAGDEASSEIAESFMAANEAFGGSAAYASPFGVRGLTRGDAEQILSSGAEAVVFVCEPDIGVARSLKTLRGAGYSGTALGLGYGGILRAEAGNALDGSWWILPASMDDPQLQSFQTSYRDRYNERVSWADFPEAILAFDSVRWMADALYRAKGFQGEALRHALLSTQNLALAHATLTTDPRTHTPWNKAVALIYCDDGSERFQKRFRPK
ncbi:MAG: ABC transporter substrate-binding protein [Synergistaceae bacterium]|nr:ABC transporter substrate-binding protein [Synergistaceae bacterium]